MNAFLIGSLSPFTTGVICGLLVVVLLAGGVMIGVALSRRHAPVSDSHMNPAQVLKMVQGLSQWTNGMSNEVSQYSNEVDQLVQRYDNDGTGDNQTAEGLLGEIRRANENLKTRLERAEATLQEQAQEISGYVSEARTDPLTDLPNRRWFDDELERRLADLERHNTPFSLVLLDIDHFKKFNDEHGHLVGDEVLKQVARVLQQSTRQTDLVARFGGEEFALVLANSTKLDGCRAAERARRSIECQTVRYEDKRLTVTASCGVSQARAGEEPDELIKRADEALYASKKNGRNLASWHDGESITPVSAQLGPTGPDTLPLPGDFHAVCDDLKRRLEQATSD